MSFSKTFFFVLVFAGVSSCAWAEKTASERGRIDYLLHCSGCHALDARGLEAKGLPRIKDQIGYYLTLSEGRAFIMQVPGLLSAGLSDERAAGVMNWVIEYFAGRSMPQNFVPYAAEEAKRYRESKPADIAGTRRALAQRLMAAGYSFQ